MNKTNPLIRRMLVSALLLFSTALTARLGHSAEIRILRESKPQGNLVLLKDVADVFTVEKQDAKALRSVELIPAPATGTQKYLRIEQIREALHTRGFDLRKIRFSGFSQVVVHGPEKKTATPEAPRSYQYIDQHVVFAIERYLKQTVEDNLPFQVEVQLNDSQRQALASLAGAMEIQGGQPPWTGKQLFQVNFTTGEGSQSLTLNAQIDLPEAVVVARAPIQRGTILRASDLELRPHKQANNRNTRTVSYQSIADVVGMESTRTIGQGTVLNSTHLRKPILVRQNEVVTVYARTSGIEVRTTGRARQEGSQGDVIEIESLAPNSRARGKKVFFARVTGIQEVDVYAQAMTADSTASRR